MKRRRFLQSVSCAVHQTTLVNCASRHSTRGHLEEIFMEFDDLRPPQKTAISLLRASWKAHKNHLINAPCGFGKTALASYLAQSFASVGKRVVFVAPYVTLVDQTYTRFQQYGHNDLSVIWRDDPRHDSRAMVQIASADTIIRRQWPANCDVMIWDE